MRLALAEILRRRGRWVSIVGRGCLIVFLVLVLAALADELFIGMAGALKTRGRGCPGLLSDGRRSLIRSELPISALSSVAAVEGVADAGALGVLLATAATGADSFDIAVMGHLPGHAGEPTSLVEGRRPELGEPFVGLADVSLRAEGILLGDSVTLTSSVPPSRGRRFRRRRAVPAGRHALGTAGDLGEAPFRGTAGNGRPRSVAQAFPILVDEGADVEAVAAAVDRALTTTETVTTDEAILALPGVEQQQSTFTAIIVVSFLVVGIVIGLFFALITLEKRGQFAILKAIGSSNPFLLRGVLVQALIATVARIRAGFRAIPVPDSHPSSTVPVVFLPTSAIPVPRDRHDGRSRRSVFVPPNRSYRPSVRSRR